jgi:hypothetical protein
MCSCKDSVEQNMHSSNQIISGIQKIYQEKIYKHVEMPDTSIFMNDSAFKIGPDSFIVRIKNYEKGPFVIVDTFDYEIRHYRESFLDISINENTITLDKSLFKKIYDDENTFYKSGLGKTFIRKIDAENKKIIFETFFGYYFTDQGELLIYSLTPDLTYEYIKMEQVQLGISR